MPRLFYWPSKAFANYARGTIAVAADTVDQARMIARREADAAILKRWEWWDLADDDDQAAFKAKRAEVSEDLNAPPVEADGCALFINGGE